MSPLEDRPIEERAPVHLRERYYGELAHAQASGATASAALVRAEAEARALEQRGDEVYSAHARGLAHDADVEVYREERARAAIEVADATARVHGAHRAQKQIEQDLNNLYSLHLGAFLAEAEDTTQEAAAAIEAMREQYMEAVAAWKKAEAKWRPLLAAIRTDLEEQNQARGVWPPAEHVARLASVPACPLPDPGLVFGDVAARPRGVSPALVVGEPPEPEFAVDVPLGS